MHRLNQLFDKQQDKLLNIYFTAGYPQLEATTTILQNLQAAGVDMVEIGMPYSDPLADGPTIQKSGSVALQNGMSVAVLFEQLKEIRNTVSLPIILMGYLNPVLQYGIEAFFEQCAAVGVDGLILPDMPLDVYEKDYAALYERYNIRPIFLITPNTSEERIRQIDALTNAFIYVVSTAATTGKDNAFSAETVDYFNKIKQLNLRNPCMIGFGISNHQNFETACQYASGAIIGSAFIRHLSHQGYQAASIQSFVDQIKGSFVLK